jgi:hypothetical protein
MCRPAGATAGTEGAEWPVVAPPDSVARLPRAPIATPPESAAAGAAAPTPADSAAAPAHTAEAWPSLAAIDSSLVLADAARNRLAEADRAVLDELLAAAREMRAAGDVEAAALLAADAVDYLRSRSR